MATPTNQPEPTLSATSLRGHMPVLDGLRGLAIIMVLLHHCTDMTARTAVDHASTLLLHWGGFGVDLFFVLSGFLITGILAETRGRRHYFRSFYARRVLRIFPLYYLIVALSFFVLPNVGAVLAGAPGVSDQTASLIESKLDRFGGVGGDEWYYWAYVSNFAVAKADAFRHGILDVSWSLSIEEQFYLVWPLMVALVGALRMRWVCGLLIVGSPLFRAWFLSLEADPLFGGAPTMLDVFMLTPGRVEGLALGALLALWLRSSGTETGPGERLARLKPWAKVVAPVALLASFATGVTSDMNPSEPTYLAGVAGITLVAIGFAAVLVLALGARPGTFWHRVWTWRPLVSFGKYSYAIYLTHLPVRAVIRDLVYGPNSNGERFGDAWITFPMLGGSELLGQVLFFVPAFLACWCVGWLSWHVFEKHVLKLKRFFPYRERSG